MTAIHLQEMAHAHAVALWDELSELIMAELVKHVSPDELNGVDIGPRAIEIFERKILDIIEECADMFSELR